MSIEEFIKNITKEELQALNEGFAKKENKIPRYSYSKIGFSELKEMFNIKISLEHKGIFNEWFQSEIEINEDDTNFLKELIRKNGALLKTYKEEDLKIKFISKILSKVDFFSYENNFMDFYEENITYETEEFILTGTTDFLVSKGLRYSEKPYFFIQEFKRNKGAKDPEPQLVAELISGLELNNWKTIKGAFIIGSIWNFVILEKLGENKYQYFISENFDSSKIGDLIEIYKNLLFVKQEIMEFSKKDLQQS